MPSQAGFLHLMHQLSSFFSEPINKFTVISKQYKLIASYCWLLYVLLLAIKCTK